MNRTELIKHLEDMFANCVGIVKVKNQDYAEDGNSFANFEVAASLAGITVEQIILSRIGDKLGRLRNVISKGNTAVKDESVSDTVHDLVNYLGILSAYIESSKNP